MRQKRKGPGKGPPELKCSSTYKLNSQSAQSKARPICGCGCAANCEHDATGWCFDESYERWRDYDDAVGAFMAARRKARRLKRQHAVLGGVLQ